ncbi:M28 family peptidase [Rhodococcus fascians]|jgi:Zn-dependent M28 family amino/carboxypeptidase|uniref:M28 family peptidase n=1 Tax=Nocardiaceae TaxID=85025 RepID=UPI00050C84A9|nr:MULTISPECIES: M28 family peptidase [Rhodococcus]MBY4011085.1 M28 family peptidase [Rhodococcus fascians]MBJ7324160.1 M28 family peptidase [Rhodococcus sp. (in: high G+C Gram-positive bacteria)]MBY4021548.1 M28 family peptidase [Rhodococcus fascians]MBY4206347.1 M28 family peptidase [Rhodococcus fascians]MBY4276117.1 M28 family peptidase [Rhodococcus fascians]
MRISLLAGSAVTVLILAGCSSSSGTGDEEPARVFATPDGAGLSEAVTEDALVGHLQELEDIAAAHDGNRAAGTAGYDASVDYVVSQLESAGFDVTTPEFDFDTFEAQTQTLSLAGTEIPVFALSYSPTTSAEGITARVVGAPAGADGCEAADYAGLDLTGAVAVVPRGVCPFGAKQTVAAELGAAAAIIVNNEPGPLDSGTLGDSETAKIPTGGVSQEDGAAVLAAPEVTLTLVTTTESTTSRNIIAQTTTGSTENVVVAGAHLDSVPEGPGINDNGTGTSAVLETALQMGSAPEVTNAVRFAFWGAEENGLVGSTKYVEGLSDEDKRNIALYLNFDMIGSHNPGYLAYDGDDSDQVGEPAGPAGSDAIERTFVEHLAADGIAVDGTDFDGRSDYGPFIEVGIPAGGVFSGADENKTAEQAAKWGGTADQTFDENYHTDQDTLANVDRAALAKNGAAVAYGIGVYAQSVEGPNGVPVGAAREAARAEG